MDEEFQCVGFLFLGYLFKPKKKRLVVDNRNRHKKKEMHLYFPTCINVQNSFF